MQHLLADPALNFKFAVKEALRQFGNWEAEKEVKTSWAAVRLCIKARQKLNLVLDAAVHLEAARQNCMFISSKFMSWTAYKSPSKKIMQLLKLPRQGYCHGLYQYMWYSPLNGLHQDQNTLRNFLCSF